MAADIGAKVGIDGEKAFRDSLGAINSQLKTLGSEMKSVVSSFAGMEDSEESLTAKSDVLQRSISASGDKLKTLQGQSERAKAKLEKLSDELENAKREFGENSTEALKAQNAYNRQVVTVNKLKTQINTTTAEMNKMEAEMKQLGNSADNLSDDFKSTEKNAASFGDVLKANILGQVIVDGIKSLARAVKDMAGEFVDAAAAVKAESSQFEQTFGEFGGQAEAAIGRVAKSSGILETRLNTLGAQIYAFARSSGGDTAQSMTLMEKSLQAAADGAAYYDKSLEETTETLQSFLKGNYANDAALGLSSTEATRNAAAMDLFGKKFNNLTEIQKQETLLQMVLDAQKLSGAMGQATREADGWENVQGNLNEAWRQFQANVGAPLLESLVPAIQAITDGLIEMTSGVDWKAFSDSITGFVSSIVDNKDAILATIVGIGTGLLAWGVASMIIGLVEGIKKFKDVTTTATTAQALFNTVMGANPAVKIAMLIIGIVTALVTFIATNDEARAKVLAVWDALKTNVGAAIEGIKGFVDGLKEKFLGFIDWLKGIPSQMKEVGKNLIEGLWNGITDKVAWLKGKVSGVVDKIKGWFTGKDGFDTHSPSKWTEKIGGWVMQGLGIGMKKDTTALSAARTATAKIGNVIKKEIEATSAAIQKMQSDAAKAQAEEEIKQYKESLRKKTEELKKAEKKDRQSILDEIAKMESDWNKKQADAAKKAEQEKLNKKLTALQEFQTEYETALSEIESKQKTLDDKLAGYGELFEKTQNEDGKELFKLGDIEGDIKKIEKFGEAVDKIKEKGISGDLLAEISNMDMDDAVLYMDKLNSLDDSAFDEYVKSYQEKQALANEVSKKFYADEMQALETDTLNKISSFESDFIDVGKMLTDGVSSGIENGKSGLISTITSVLQAAVKAAKEEMDINSPSGVFEEIGDYMGQGLDVGWISRMKTVSKNIKNSLSDAAVMPRLATGGNSGVSNSYNYGGISLFIDTVNNGNGRDTQIMAQELEFVRRQQVTAKGGK